MRVVCRLRPPLCKSPTSGEPSEKTRALHPGERDVVVVAFDVFRVETTSWPDLTVLLTCLQEPGGTTEFSFDQVLEHSVHGDELYSLSCKPSVEAFLDGNDACILTYGQTCSGKTYTVRELVPLIAGALFGHKSTESATECDTERTVRVRAIEIYNEKLVDLLCVSSLPSSPRGGGNASQSAPEISMFEAVSGKIEMQGVSHVDLASSEDFVERTTQVLNRRAVAATTANNTSSRSHCIIRVSMIESSSSTVSNDLFLVDLAGSEKMKRTDAQGRAAVEAGHINKSLSTLSNVMRSLSCGAKHVPFRDSKLTRILQHALREHSATTLILCCSPDQCDICETISTMKFGFNVAMIMPIFKPKSPDEKSPGPSPDTKEAITQLKLENKSLKTKVASLERTQEFLERSLVGLRKELSEENAASVAATEPQKASSRDASVQLLREERKSSHSHSPLSHLSVLIAFLVKAALALQIVARLSLIIERSFVQ